MKMSKFIGKFLLALILLLLLALSVFIGFVAVGAVPISTVTNYLEGVVVGGWNSNVIILGASALVLFIVVIWILATIYSGDKSQGYTRLAETEDGEIAISIQTIRQISSAFVATKPDISASASTIYPVRDGIMVNVRICVKEGSVLPDVTKTVQKELKAHIESITGLVVKNVKIDVDNNRSNYSGRTK